VTVRSDADILRIVFSEREEITDLKQLQEQLGYTQNDHKWQIGLFNMRVFGVLEKSQKKGLKARKATLTLSSSAGNFARLLGAYTQRSLEVLGKIEDLEHDIYYYDPKYGEEVSYVRTTLGSLTVPVIQIGSRRLPIEEEAAQLAETLGVELILDSYRKLRQERSIYEQLETSNYGASTLETSETFNTETAKWEKKEGFAGKPGASKIKWQPGLTTHYTYTNAESDEQPRKGTKREVAWAALAETGWEIPVNSNSDINRLYVPVSCDLPDTIAAGLFACTGAAPERRHTDSFKEGGGTQLENGWVAYPGVTAKIAETVAEKLGVGTKNIGKLIPKNLRNKEKT